MGFFRQIKDSVTDFRFYREIKDNRFGRTFIYILLLFLIVYSINTVSLYINVKNAMDVVALELSEKAPEFVLSSGELEFSGEMPYYVYNDEMQAIVIDTTGQTSEDAIKSKMTGILLTKDRMYVKNQMQYNVMNYSDMGDLTFTKQDLINFLPKISNIVLVFMVILFIFVLGMKLLQAVLIALAGMIFSSAFKVELKFRHLYNFAIYALTLPLLLQVAHNLSGLSIPFFSLIYWIIAILYIGMAVRYYRDYIANESVPVLVEATLEDMEGSKDKEDNE